MVFVPAEIKSPNDVLDLLTASRWRTNNMERAAMEFYLKRWEAQDDIDKKILPYINKLIKSEKILTIFSCWGHDTNGYLLFRSRLKPQTLIDTVWFPIVENIHNKPIPRGQWDGVKLVPHKWPIRTHKVGYCLEWHSLTADEDKHTLLGWFCDLVL